MTNPRHYLFLTFVYLLVVAGVCALLATPLRAAFMANWGFNLLILGAVRGHCHQRVPNSAAGTRDQLD